MAGAMLSFLTAIGDMLLTILLLFVPSDSIAYWNEAPRVIATNVLPYMACDSTGVPVSDIVQGDILIGVSCDGINTNVMLPDGRRAIIPSSMCVCR